MATLSSDLLLVLLALGESSYGSFADWGAVTNDNLSNLEGAVSALTQVTVTTANVTLTDVQARSLFIQAVGDRTANRALVVPSRKRVYYISSASSTGGFALVVRTAAAGANVSLEDGQAMFVYCDGTDVYAMSGWEYFSNSDGVSLRHPSGVQICIERRSASAFISGASSPYWSSALMWNFPQSFKVGTVPFASATIEMGNISGGGGVFRGIRWTGGNRITVSSYEYYHVGTSAGTVAVDTNLFAIGLWR